jgi:hypothetical protein
MNTILLENSLINQELKDKLVTSTVNLQEELLIKLPLLQDNEYKSTNFD